MGETVQEIKIINSGYKIDRKVKSSIGNVEAKELLCMTHGHELMGQGMQVRGVVQGRGE